MGALANFNLLMVIGSNFTSDAFGDTARGEHETAGKYKNPFVVDGPDYQFCKGFSGESLPSPAPVQWDALHGRRPLNPRARAEPWQVAGGSDRARAGADIPFESSREHPSSEGPFESATSSWSSGIRASGSSSDNVAEQCQRACPGMVVLPEELVEYSFFFPSYTSTPRSVSTIGQITVVMSRDNIAALSVICALSVLGAIYLWKLCTRRHCTCKLCRNQYRQFDLLGSGGYGSVYLVDRLHDGAKFVAKKIPVDDITEVDEYSKEAKELITLRHQHIVSYEEDFVHVEHGTLEPKTFFFIIMEFCPEGDLKEKIELEYRSFTEDYVRVIFSQILQAVQYLHSKNVIHRDLKSQNVFLAQDGLVRLGDFGLCRHTRALAGTKSMTHAGTDCYMAPEMLSSSRYGKPADMWSMGCVLYEMCAGHFMWELDGMLGAMVMKDPHTVSQLVHDNVVSCVGNLMRSLMKRLLSTSPMARPTATTCMRKKIFKRGFPLSRQDFGECLSEDEEAAIYTPQDRVELEGEDEEFLPECSSDSDDDDEDDGGQSKVADSGSHEQEEDEEDSAPRPNRPKSNTSTSAELQHHGGRRRKQPQQRKKHRIFKGR